jgi:hypothetical protein
MIHSLRCCAALGRVRWINRDEKRKFRDNAEHRNGRQSGTLTIASAAARRSPNEIQETGTQPWRAKPAR